MAYPRQPPGGLPRSLQAYAPRGFDPRAPPGRDPRLAHRGPSEEPVDVHELLKGQAFADDDPRTRSRQADCSTHFEVSRPCPSAVHGVSDQYLVLDSNVKNQSSEPRAGRYNFNFMVQGETGTLTRPQVGVKDTLDTITEVQVGAFALPLPLLIDYSLAAPGLTLAGNAAIVAATDPVTGVLSQLLHGQRVTLFLPEIGMQSISGFRHRYHFEFTAEIVGAFTDPNAHMLLTPVIDRFIFTEPIQNIHGLTLQFYGPDYPLRLPADSVFNVSLRTDGAGLLEVVAPGAGASHGLVDDFTAVLQISDRIFLEGVNSASPALNSYLNRADGHLVGAVGLAAASFRLNPDVDPDGFGIGAAIPQLAGSGPIVLRIAKHRVRVPLRLRRVVQRLTNYISP